MIVMVKGDIEGRGGESSCSSYHGARRGPGQRGKKEMCLFLGLTSIFYIISYRVNAA